MDFLRNLGYRMRTGLQRFMMGRYGSDKLNMALLVAALVICVISMFIPSATVKLICMLLYYFFMGVAVFRMLSRNTYKRYRENRKYLMLIERFRDREHRYYDCPQCRQQVRVPRRKGKISITCPKCKHKFIRKT